MGLYISYTGRVPANETGHVIGEPVEGGFRAGSYSGFNAWRANLAKMAHGVEPSVIWQSPEDKFVAFRGLIDHSDCDGTINAKTSAMLAADFAAFQERAVQFAKAMENEEDGRWFLTKYKDWRAAFAIAAHRGEVVFG